MKDFVDRRVCASPQMRDSWLAGMCLHQSSPLQQEGRQLSKAAAHPQPEVEYTVFQSARKKGCRVEQRVGTARTASSLVFCGRNEEGEQVFHSTAAQI